ncbi:hypothetical protein D3C87_369720 [compost metagenome]
MNQKAIFKVFLGCVLLIIGLSSINTFAQSNLWQAIINSLFNQQFLYLNGIRLTIAILLISFPMASVFFSSISELGKDFLFKNK